MVISIGLGFLGGGGLLDEMPSVEGVVGM